MLLAQSQRQSIRDRYAAILAQGNGRGEDRNALEVVNRDIMHDLLEYLVEEVLPQLTSPRLQARITYLLGILRIPLGVEDLMLLRDPAQREAFLRHLPPPSRNFQLFDAQHTRSNDPLYASSCLVETMLRIAGEINQQRSTDDIELRPMSYFDPLQTYQRRCARYQNTVNTEPARYVPVVHYADSPAAGEVRDALPGEGFVSDLGDDVTHYTPEVLSQVGEDLQADWSNFALEMAQGGGGFVINFGLLMQRNIELGFTNISRGLGEASAASRELTAARAANDQQRIHQAERRLYQAELAVITGVGRTTASFLTFELTPGFYLELRNMIRNHEPARAIGYLIGLLVMTFGQLRASVDIIRELGARGDAIIQGGRVLIRRSSLEEAREMYRARMAERAPVHIGGTGVRLLSYHLVVPIFIDAYRGAAQAVGTARHAARYLSDGLEVRVQSASSQFELADGQEAQIEGNRGTWVEVADFTVRAQARARQFRRSVMQDSLGVPRRVVDATLGRRGRASEINRETADQLVRLMRKAWRHPAMEFELFFGREETRRVAGRAPYEDVVERSSIRVSGEIYRRLVEAVARGDHATFRSLIAEYNRTAGQPFNEASIPQLFDAMQSQANLMSDEGGNRASWCRSDIEPATTDPGRHRTNNRFDAREFLQEARSGRRRMDTRWNFSYEVSPDPAHPTRPRSESRALTESEILEILYRHMIESPRVQNQGNRAEQAQRYVTSQAVDKAVLRYFSEAVNNQELQIMVQRAARGILFGHQEVGLFGRFRRGGHLYLDRALNPGLIRRFGQTLLEVGGRYTFEAPRYRGWRDVHSELMGREHDSTVRRYAEHQHISEARARIRLAQRIYNDYVIDRTECVLDTMRSILGDARVLTRGIFSNHFQEVVQANHTTFEAALNDFEARPGIAQIDGPDGAIERVFERENVPATPEATPATPPTLTATPTPVEPPAPPQPLGELSIVEGGNRAVIRGTEGTEYRFTLRDGMTCTVRETGEIRYFDFKTSEGALIESYTINPETGVLESTRDGSDTNANSTRSLRNGLNRELRPQARRNALEVARMAEYHRAVSALGEANGMDGIANSAAMQAVARNGLEALGRVTMEEFLGRLDMARGRVFWHSPEGARFRAWLATPESRTAMLEGPASFAIGVLSIIGIEGMLRLLPDSWINGDSTAARSARFVLVLGSTHVLNATTTGAVRSLLTRGTEDAAIQMRAIRNLMRINTRALGVGALTARHGGRTLAQVTWRAFGQRVVGLSSLGRMATGMGGMYIAGRTWDSAMTEMGVERDSALRGEVVQFIASWGLPMVASTGRRLATFLLTRAGGAAAAEALGPLGTVIEIFGLACMAIDLAYTFTTGTYQQSLDTRLNEVLRAGAISISTIRARVPRITNATINQLFERDPNSAGDDRMFIPRDNFATLVRRAPAEQREALQALYQESQARLAAMGWDVRYLRPLILSTGFIGREQLARAIRHAEDQTVYDYNQAAAQGQHGFLQQFAVGMASGEAGEGDHPLPMSESQAHTIISAYSSMIYRDLETSRQVTDSLRTQISALRQEDETPEEFSTHLQQTLGQRINFTSSEEQAYTFLRQVLGTRDQAGEFSFAEVTTTTTALSAIGGRGGRAPESRTVTRETGRRITISDLDDPNFTAELSSRFGIREEDVARFMERTNIRMLQDQIAFLHGVDADAVAPAEEMARAHLGEDASPADIQAEASRIGTMNDDVRQMFDAHGVLTAGHADQFMEWLETPSMRIANLMEQQERIIQMVGFCVAGEIEVSNEEQELFTFVSERYHSLIPESAWSTPTQEQLEMVTGEVLHGFTDANDAPYLAENGMVDMHNPTLVQMQRAHLFMQYEAAAPETRPQLLTLLRVQYALAVTAGDTEGRTADELRETLVALQDDPETWLGNNAYLAVLEQIEQDMEQASAEGPLPPQLRQMIIMPYISELLDIDSAVML
jgi:hypothetical protein